MIDIIPSCKKHNGAGVETWIQPWRFLLHMAKQLFFRVRISMNLSNTILLHCLLAFSRIALMTHQPVVSKLSYKHNLQYIVFRLFFLLTPAS